ncbi:penicillin-binding protein 1C [Methylovorus menthalis]|uniref:penicillin-binding protein 1C n=1 Tax=Methylovorus menthalis TaxID=1002227 RepID=UPI001E430A67|nr:penicillin-binding protein 1C [Methylovorus menthalis]MCB4812038.1 penicillin-binding protein 1C [Methylovorus menthalis]
MQNLTGQKTKPQRQTRQRVLLATLGLLLGLLPGMAAAVPGYAEVKAQYRASDAWLLARDGQVLQQLRLDHQVRRLQWTPLEAMSPALLQALLYSEDQRFYQHAGIDWLAVASASWRNLWDSRTRGASTITMQLAGLLEQDAVHGRRSLVQKLGQSADALQLDHAWKKSDILEAYLNLVPFRGELQGVAAMSQGLFGKGPEALDAREAAVAVVLLRAPNAKPARVAERACQLLKQMQQARACADLEGFASLKLVAPFEPAMPNLAPHLARQLLQQPGQRLRSTLDVRLQQYAARQLRANLLQLENQNVQDGAVLVLDNRTGEVLAWVGSSDTLSSAPAVDGVLAQRQAGSTLKPFLYATALDMRALTAASLLDDSPVRIRTGNGDYIPQNYDKQFMGPVSLRTALGSSLNVPAVRSLLHITPDRFFARLQQLRFSTLTESVDYYGYSLALGAADVRLLDLTNAYRALANQGRYSGVRMQWAKSASKGNAHKPMQVFSPAASYVVSDILADNNARAHTFGMDSALATRYWSAVKTGTSKDMRDNWCVGYTARYTVGVWVGNANGAPMHDVSGVSGAAPVWRAVMDYLHTHPDGRLLAPVVRPLPAGLLQQQVRFQPAIEPPRQEFFLKGTELALVRASNDGDDVRPSMSGQNKQRGYAQADNQLVSIAYPAQGSIIALDPEIPPALQRVVFKASPALPAGWHWRLDGKRVAPVKMPSPRPLPGINTQAANTQAANTPVADLRYAWFPMPGRHVLSLHDASGKLRESARFEVRGAMLREAMPSPKAKPARRS